MHECHAQPPPSRARLLAPAFSRPPSRARLLAPAFSRLNNTLLLLLALACPGLAAPSPAVPWDTNAQGGYVTALGQDRQGRVWAASESDGVWEFSPSAPTGKQWTQFTTENTGGGLGDDDCYSLACDRLGRIWCGTGRDGVSVFNGKAWRTYDRLTGPLGCHVTALAVSPKDGSVWAGSELGIARYADGRGWRYWTRADGLPSDQITCLAFAPGGTLFAGTACDGLAIASPADNYSRWRHVPGPDALPDAPGGDGLPSPLVNCLLVSKGGTVYAGTDCGLAHSTDNGLTWRFLRGADWKDKLAGLETPVAPRDVDTGGRLLSEDYITALAEDGADHLFIGHRQKGLGVYDEVSAQGVTTPDAYGGYVDALLPTAHGHLLIGTYGDGLTVTDCAAPPPPAVASKSPGAFPPLPSPAAPPTSAQLAAMLRRVRSLPSPPPGVGASFLGEDWQTQGDEVGRYGRQYAVLCAMNHVITCTNRYAVQGVMGDHHAPGDGLRWWVTWMQTDTQRSLYTPVAGVRRQAEWDDHGEAYPMTREGPDIWIALHLGEGDRHRVSLYFMNKDGGPGGGQDNRYRDYTVEVRPFRGTVAASEAAPVLARARVRQFWGGVYECFLLRGPGDYALRVSRNGSFNTILSGVFVDKVAGKATVEDGEALAYMSGVHYDPPAPGPLPRGARAASAASLWSALDGSWGAAGGEAVQGPYRLLAYRALAASGGPAQTLSAWRWSLRLWTPDDRTGFDAAMAHARSARVKLAHARTPAEVAAASE